MTSRERILADLRRNAPAPVPMPDIPAGTEYADPAAQFLEVFTAVGGTGVRVAGRAAIPAKLAELPIYREARLIASLVEGIESRGLDPMAVADPHELAPLDLSILPAELGVAENGAVWISGSKLGPNRAVFVIAQHLLLVLDAARLVSNMHQAYARIQIERPGFGLFISGPSKTADIEQALVIGAHGARSCTLFLIE